MRVIAVDFDGTLCESVWPGIGAPNIELIEWCKEKQAKGDKIILWTCREKKRLKEALGFLRQYDFIPDAANENVPEMIDKYGVDCRKIAAHIYIDDSAIDRKKFGLPFRSSGNHVEPKETKPVPPKDNKPQTIRIV